MLVSDLVTRLEFGYNLPEGFLKQLHLGLVNKEDRYLNKHIELIYYDDPHSVKVFKRSMLNKAIDFNKFDHHYHYYYGLLSVFLEAGYHLDKKRVDFDLYEYVITYTKKHADILHDEIKSSNFSQVSYMKKLINVTRQSVFLKDYMFHVKTYQDLWDDNPTQLSFGNWMQEKTVFIEILKHNVVIRSQKGIDTYLLSENILLENALIEILNFYELRYKGKLKLVQNIK